MHITKYYLKKEDVCFIAKIASSPLDTLGGNGKDCDKGITASDALLGNNVWDEEIGLRSCGSEGEK